MKAWWLVLALTPVWSGLGADEALGSLVEDSIRNEAVAGSERAVGFLVAGQRADGSWSQHPGITAAATYALARTRLNDAPEVKAAIARGADFIVKHARADGSIGNQVSADNDVYSTAICLLALTMLGREQDGTIMAAARRYLLGRQSRSGLEYSPGGTGYGGSAYPDLSNTHWALEALHLVEELRPAKEPDPASGRLWARSAKLVASCQLADGGFTYCPVDAGKPGTRHPELKGREVWGSLSYGGLKTLKYAAGNQVSVEPGLGQAAGWAARNYHVDENPGLKDGGLYYYYYMFASAWGALGQDWVEMPGGPRHNWRSDLLQALLERQRGQGEWRNENPLWMEQDANLCTAYALLAMQFALFEPVQ